MIPFKSCAPLVLCLLIALAGCQRRDAGPEVTHARVVLPPPGMGMAVGYFELRNPGSTPMRLRGVSSEAFASVEMHETLSENGISRMRELDEAEVPAQGSISFEPGGKHLMLMGGPEGEPVDQTYPMMLEIVELDGRSHRVEARFEVERAGDGHSH